MLDEIDSELKRLLRDGITEKEFREGKQQLRGGYLLGLESPGGRMQAMGRGMLLLDRIITPADTIARIDAVTLDDVMAAAHRILTVEPCLAAAGKGAAAFAK